MTTPERPSPARLAEIRGRLHLKKQYDDVDAISELLAEIDALMQEFREVHAFLTGKYEMGWCMTHPDGEPDSELGRAAKSRNCELNDAYDLLRTIRGALGAIGITPTIPLPPWASGAPGEVLLGVWRDITTGLSRNRDPR